MPSAARTPPFGTATALALLAGISASLALPSPWHWLLQGIAAIVGAVLWTRPHRLRVLGALVFGFGLCGLHVSWVLAHQLPLELELRDVAVRGRVVDLPASETRATWFAFRVDDDMTQRARLRGRLLQLAWYEDFKPVAPSRRNALHSGSRWEFVVRLRAPRGLRNPGSADSERSALAQRITATGYLRNPAGARELSAPHGIDHWRDRMSMRISASVPDVSSRFVRALALGDTRGLGDDDWEILRASGLTHLIAISGFHVGMVAVVFAWLVASAWRLFPMLATRIARPQAMAIAALFGAVGYAAVAGFALPTVRTVLMIAVVVVARLLRRHTRVADSLALALFAIALVDPLSVLTPGFWLSFAGVAWLAWCLPDAGRRPLRDFLCAQGVATLGLLPLTVMLFGQASLAGPVANLVAIPWWSFVVVPLSLAGTALEALHAGLGAWAWQLAASCFGWSWHVFAWLAASDFALWWLPEPQWFALPLAVLGAFWCLMPRGVPGKWLALLLWLPLLWPDRALPRAGDAELTVLDVGQGLSVVVRTQRHALLYDMGPAKPDGFDAGERVVLPSLRALGVRRLDAAVISHGDNDHAGGFPAVQRGMPPPVAWSPAGVGIADTRPCLAGREWRWDGVRFRFLHPPLHFPYLDNESSCVLRIETAHGVALLTGDIGAVIERDLVRRDAALLRADVVLVAHHGSHESSDPSFIAATHTRHALVSAGYANRYGHPAADVVARWTRSGASIADTLDGGALRVRLQAGGVVVETRRGSHPSLWDAVRQHERLASEATTLSYRPD